MLIANVNQLVHSASPFWFGIGLQTFTVAGKTIETGYYALGAIHSPNRGIVTAELRLGGAYASGESLLVNIGAMQPDGTERSIVTATVDDTFGGGTINLLAIDTASPLLAADVLFANVTYTAGGGPAAPLATIVVQAAG